MRAVRFFAFSIFMTLLFPLFSFSTLHRACYDVEHGGDATKTWDVSTCRARRQGATNSKGACAMERAIGIGADTSLSVKTPARE